MCVAFFHVAHLKQLMAGLKRLKYPTKREWKQTQQHCIRAITHRSLNPEITQSITNKITHNMYFHSII